MSNAFGWGYPAGAEHDPNAPYNEVEIPEMEFEVVVSQCLSKYATVFSNNYIPEYDPESGRTTYDTSDIEWYEEYGDNDHYTPEQLLKLFKKFLEDEINGTETVSHKPKYLEHLIEECDGWSEDETEITEE